MRKPHEKRGNEMHEGGEDTPETLLGLDKQLHMLATRLESQVHWLIRVREEVQGWSAVTPIRAAREDWEDDAISPLERIWGALAIVEGEMRTLYQLLIDEGGE